MPSAYDSADFAALLDAAVAEADWDGFEARRAEAAARGRLRGIGCAVFIEPAGGVSPTDEAAITFEPDGGILLHEVAIASGQGHETVLPGAGRPRAADRPGAHHPARRPAGRPGAEGRRRVRLAQHDVAGLGQRASGRDGAEEGPGAGRRRAGGGRGRHRLRRRRVPHRRHRPRDRAAELARRHPGALDSTAELPRPAPSRPAPTWRRWRSTRTPA